MEGKDIIKRFKNVNSIQDYTELINSLKIDEFGEDCFSYTATDIRYLMNLENPKRFRTFSIPKKSGGFRQIAIPYAKLKGILYQTKNILDAHYKPKQCVQGFAIGRSVVGNAEMHIHQNYVFNIDLSDFFPSISLGRICTRLQLPPYNFSKKVSNIIACLCTMKYDDNNGGTFNALPQGAPTSPILSNIVCEQLDRRLMGVAKKFGLHYSRYADDMTFSSMHNVYDENGEFRTELRRIISDQGFIINEKKTRLQKIGSRQEVTGLIVGDKVNVSREYINELRSTLHVWEKFGYADAYAWFYSRYKANKGHSKKGEPVLENVIDGKLNYLKMVKGETDSTYKKLRTRFESLVSILYNERPKQQVRHVKVSYSIQEFIKKFGGVKIVFLTASDGHVSGKLTSEGVTTPIYFDKKFRASTLEDKKQILCAIENGTSDWFISEIEDLDKRYKYRFNHFWQISKYQPKIGGQRKDIDVESLLEIWERDGLDKATNMWKLQIEGNFKSNIKMEDQNSRSASEEEIESMLHILNSENYSIDNFDNLISLEDIED